MLACGDEPRDEAAALFSAGKQATKRSGGVAIGVDGMFRERQFGEYTMVRI